MKTLKKQFKSVALILSMLILLQGCTVYKSVPISIEQAVQNESKVKVFTKNNNKLKFKRIINVDGKLYGVRNLEGIDRNLSLDRNSIETIKEKNKTLSTILSIAIPVVIIAGLLGILTVSSFNNLECPCFPIPN